MKNAMDVPFIDLPAQHRIIRDKLDLAIKQVFDRSDFALGEDVAMFEEEFATFCRARYAVGVDSGLSALELSLCALGIGPGDEVIIPAHSFIATAAAVTFAGAKPVLVDVDPATYDIDVAQIEAAITPRTKAIIPVHLYGLPAEMDAILQVANRYSLAVIEDACQAHGATYLARRVGSLGHAAAFSFHSTSNLGSCSDGGIVLTNDREVADRTRALRDYGQNIKYSPELPPYNHRLDTLQAAILRVKLHYLDMWNESRQQIAAAYKRPLEKIGVITPIECPECKHVYHLYVIRTPHRDELQAYLRGKGIATAIHYPIPIHLQPYFSEHGFREGQFPVAEQVCKEVISLPMFPEMTEEQVQYVTTQVNEFAMIGELNFWP